MASLYRPMPNYVNFVNAGQLSSASSLYVERALLIGLWRQVVGNLTADFVRHLLHRDLLASEWRLLDFTPNPSLVRCDSVSADCCGEARFSEMQTYPSSVSVIEPGSKYTPVDMDLTVLDTIIDMPDMKEYLYFLGRGK